MKSTRYLPGILPFLFAACAWAQPVIVTQPTNQAVLLGSNVTFTVAASGAGPLSYQWQHNGTNIDNNVIVTVAGNGTRGYSGDGGAATNASLVGPAGVAADAAGNFYIVDYNTNVIRKVDTDGIITTVAGNGDWGYTGDGGAATNASFNGPDGIAVDAAGNLYIADSGNTVIRKVDTNGIITTVAGEAGRWGYSGDGGAATNATLYWPGGLAVDGGGNLYIADTYNEVIRKMATNGIITTVAGQGGFWGYSGDGGAATNATLTEPAGVALDASGNLYIADTYNNCIRRVDTDGVITTVAGTNSSGFSGDGGAAIYAQLWQPNGVAVDQWGNLFIADTYNNRIRRMDTNGVITTVAGNQQGGFSGDGDAAANASLYDPDAVALTASGDVLIADELNNRIRAITPGRWPSLQLGNANPSLAGSYDVIVTGPSGSVTSSVVTLIVMGPPVIITQPTNQMILVGSNVTFNVSVSSTGPFSYQWQFNGTNLPNNLITTVAGNGNSSFSGDGGPATNAGLLNPYGLALDSTGNLYISDNGNRRVRQVDTNGNISTIAGTNSSGYSGDGGLAALARLNSPSGVAVDGAGNLFIADKFNERIRRVDTNRMITTAAGTNGSGYSGDGGLATLARLSSPSGVAVDSAGNIFIADTSNNRVRKVDASGIISTIAGTNLNGFSGDGGLATLARLNSPSGVAVDQSGNVFIADTSNNRVRRVDTNGIITTVAGTNTTVFSGDGGPAANAGLAGPEAVTIDASGYLLIADTGHQRIRQVDVNGIITTVAGINTSGFSGDGGAATNASLSNPSGLAVAPSGDLLIADQYNNRVRKAQLGRSPVLPLDNASTNLAGSYDVIVTGPYGSVTSSVVTLTILFPPGVAVQPQTTLVTNGDTATFSVTASGTAPFGYQWYFNSNVIGGGTNAVLNIPNAGAGQAGNYRCVITNAYGAVTSSIAALIVMGPPVITIQPTNQFVLNGSNGMFSVGVSGSGPFIFRWQLNGANFPNLYNTIRTVAGQQSASGSYGDGGPATSAALFKPSSVAFDAAGNMFIADTSNNRIRKVNMNQIIATVAGGGAAYPGDGGAATNALLPFPTGVAVDALGNLYIAETSHNTVRKVDTNGIITTIAGINSAGFSGDGGLAIVAKLNSPSGVAVDGLGNVLIADSGNSRVRKVDANGIITTLAGNGTASDTGDGGAATNASLNHPSGVAVDGLGNVLVSDAGNYVRKIDATGTITTLAGNGSAGYSGDGGAATNAMLSGVYGVAVDVYGDVFIADYLNYRIRMVDNTGMISTVAGNGGTGFSNDGTIATNASLYEPKGVGVDSYGNLFVVLDFNYVVRKVDLGRAPVLPLNNVTAYNAGNYDVIISNPYGSVTSSIVSLTVLSSPIITAQPASSTVLSGSSASFSIALIGTAPFSYQWYLNTNTPVNDGTNAMLSINNVGPDQTGAYFCVVTNLYGSVTSRVVSLAIGLPPVIILQPTNQTGFGGSNALLSVLVSGTGPFIYQWQLNGTNLPNNIITTVAGISTNGFSGDGGPATNAALNYPNGAVRDSAGNLLIVDERNQCIRRVDTNGIITTIAGTNSAGFSGDGGPATNARLFNPYSVTADVYGNVFIADTANRRVRKVDANGIITTLSGNGLYPNYGDGGPATNAYLSSPGDVAVDAYGDLFFTDESDASIRKVDPNSIITTIAGIHRTAGYSGDGGPAVNANLNWPVSVTVDGSGNLFIGDRNNNRIRKVDTNGIITTVAGSGPTGSQNGSYSGDGGPATNATLNYISGVTLDSAGNLFIADGNNNRIRKVDTNGIITTVAGTGPTGVLTGSYSGDGGPATSATLNFPQRLSVDGAGNLYIGDQYNQRIREVAFGGLPSLALNNLGLNNGGNYSVTISSPYGSVTSSIVSLTVIVPPQGFGASFNPGTGLQLQFSGTLNHFYTLQSATNLTPPVDWEPVVTNSTDANGNWSFTDTNTAPFPQKFYRASP